MGNRLQTSQVLRERRQPLLRKRFLYISLYNKTCKKTAFLNANTPLWAADIDKDQGMKSDQWDMSCPCIQHVGVQTKYVLCDLRMGSIVARSRSLDLSRIDLRGGYLPLGSSRPGFIDPAMVSPQSDTPISHR